MYFIVTCSFISFYSSTRIRRAHSRTEIEICDCGLNSQQMWRLHSCSTDPPGRVWKEFETTTANKFSGWVFPALSRELHFYESLTKLRLSNHIVLTVYRIFCVYVCGCHIFCMYLDFIHSSWLLKTLEFPEQ